MVLTICSYLIYLGISCNIGVRRTAVICQGKDCLWAKQEMRFFGEFCLFVWAFGRKFFLKGPPMTPKECRYPKIWDIDGPMHIVTDPIIKPRQNWQQNAIKKKSTAFIDIKKYDWKSFYSWYTMYRSQEIWNSFRVGTQRIDIKKYEIYMSWHTM